MKRRSFIQVSLGLSAMTLTPAIAEAAEASFQPKTSKKETLQMTAKNFAEKYVTLWATTDDATRSALVSELFAEDAEHYAAPAGASFIGRAAILANITNVNKGAVQQAGLVVKGGDSVLNHDAISVEWSAEAPNGQAVRTGRDILILNGRGKAERLYMFTSD